MSVKQVFFQVDFIALEQMLLLLIKAFDDELPLKKN